MHNANVAHTATDRSADSESNTFLSGARRGNYHPTLGRWMMRDPIGYAEGSNLYAYTKGMAPNRVDPLGLLMWTDLVKEHSADWLRTADVNHELHSELNRFRWNEATQCFEPQVDDTRSLWRRSAVREGINSREMLEKQYNRPVPKNLEVSSAIILQDGFCASKSDAGNRRVVVVPVKVKLSGKSEHWLVIWHYRCQCIPRTTQVVDYKTGTTKTLAWEDWDWVLDGGRKKNPEEVKKATQWKDSGGKGGSIRLPFGQDAGQKVEDMQDKAWEDGAGPPSPIDIITDPVGSLADYFLGKGAKDMSDNPDLKRRR